MAKARDDKGPRWDQQNAGQVAGEIGPPHFEEGPPKTRKEAPEQAAPSQAPTRDETQPTVDDFSSATITDWEREYAAGRPRDAEWSLLRGLADHWYPKADIEREQEAQRDKWTEENLAILKELEVEAKQEREQAPNQEVEVEQDQEPELELEPENN